MCDVLAKDRLTEDRRMFWDGRGCDLCAADTHRCELCEDVWERGGWITTRAVNEACVML